MSKPQSLDSIGPMQDNTTAPAKKDEKPKDPILAEFEEGKRFLEEKNYAQAALAFHNVLLSYEEKNDKNGIANASNRLGEVCLAKQDYDTAEKHFLRAMEIVVAADDPMSELMLNRQLLEVYAGKKEYPKAIEICLSLMEDYKNNNNPQGVVEVLEKMAQFFIDAGEKDKAKGAYRTAASIHRRYKHNNIADDLEKLADEL